MKCFRYALLSLYHTRTFTYARFFSLDFSKITGSAQMKPIVKNGLTYLTVEKLLLKFKTENMHLKFDNLFNGDKALGML